MNKLVQFKSTLSHASPSPSLSEELKALWYDAKGDWVTAHNIAQDIHNKNGSWIHAYLHRKEGDESNALYWYHRAEKKFPTISLEEEWEEITKYFLNK